MIYDSNVDLQKSDLMFLYIDGNPIAFSTSCGLSLSKETIDTANKMSGGWVSSLSGKKSWSASSEALLTKKAGANSFDTLLAALNSSNPVSITYGVGTESTYDLASGWYTGKAHVTKLDQKADNGSNCTCSVELTGTGALTPTNGTSVIAVKAAQTYDAGTGFRQLVLTVDGQDITSGGIWEVSTPLAGAVLTSRGELYAPEGTTGTIGVKVTYNGITSAAVNVTIS